MKNLKELYQEHHGKTSDKWEIYLSSYHEILSGKRASLRNMLEIGVQNGGSLEIWKEYFPNAENVIGCDINPDCSKLTYADSAIKVIIGNSSTKEMQQQISAITPKFDVIIDDGSHRSSDIIRSFLLYFPLLADDGIYIIEDLHCSYWQDFEGGLYDPYSSMAYLKKLADVPNLEHWGIKRTGHEYLESFYQHYDCDKWEFEEYDKIYSVTFINSLCIIHKKKASDNVLGLRHIVGEEQNVVGGTKEFNATLAVMPHQELNEQQNPWSKQQIFPEMEWEGLVIAQDRANKNINLLHDEIDELKTEGAEKSQLIERLSYDNHALRTSSSWKITKPLRDMILHARRIKRAVYIGSKVFETYGVKESVNRALGVYKRNGLSGLVSKIKHINQLHRATEIRSAFKTLPAVTISAQNILMPKVLIIAELSIAQCKKYRVDQKVDLFNHLNIPVTVLNWTDANACLSALQSHSIVIFYRVPAFESVKAVFKECERLNLITYWDVDDLIFDVDILRESKTLNTLDKETLKGLIDGAMLYHESLIQCKHAIASTGPLALAMENAGAETSLIIENALDPETIITAQAISEKRKSEDDGIIRIVYGSGTSTHSVDFLEAADAILNVLKSNPKIHFRLAGVLELPASFDEVSKQIERISFCPYKEYLKVLAECDISIAPLEDYIFNDSKSNIKYLEASILGLPSVCSPRPNYSSVITDGENGFLCRTPQEWETALLGLAMDEGLRKRVGAAAKANILERYSLESVAKNQVYPIISPFERKNKKHVLSVNCYYYPRSFGGATIVAEAVNKCFINDESIEIHTLTSLSEEYGVANSLHRYQAFGQDCYGIVLPNFIPIDQQIINESINEAFLQVLDVVQPDLVHFHSIQGLGITMLELCKERNIEIIVTTHDFWWLYDNQFILSYEKKSQPVENQNVENWHVIKADELSAFEIKKRKALSLASQVLSPSQYTTEVYRSEGFPHATLNKNGVSHPVNEIHKLAGSPLRFGYVGGNIDVKGYHLIKDAFKKIPASLASVVLVDNASILGIQSYEDHDLEGLNSVKVIPAFTQDNMDDFYNSIDVLLFPTQAKESFGLTVREALIRNVWVISSDAGGAAEDIIPDVNGIIIPFDNSVDKLYDAVMKTIDHYAALPQETVIELPHSHIRSFNEQFEEIKALYLQTIKN